MHMGQTLHQKSPVCESFCNGMLFGNLGINLSLLQEHPVSSRACQVENDSRSPLAPEPAPFTPSTRRRQGPPFLPIPILHFHFISMVAKKVSFTLPSPEDQGG